MTSIYPGRRFSFFRLTIAIVTALALIFGAWVWISFTNTASKKLPSPWFGGYIDVTGTPSYTFESDLGDPYNNVVLGFVTARQGSCVPGWSSYTLDDASRQFDLDSRIAQTQRSGRSVTISFGGQAGTELADACGSIDELEQAYSTVIDRYHVNSIDIDLEGKSLENGWDTQARRIQAIANILEKNAASGTPINFNLTIPVSQQGMSEQAMRVVGGFLTAHVDISQLNVMTMDYNIASDTESQSDVIKQSLNAAHDQYMQLLYTHRQLFDDAQIWKLMGATVLIGQNDTEDERFTTTDAQNINTFAQQTGLGRLSMWSLNRDRQCDNNYVNTSTALPFCSGMKQTDGEYATVLSSGFKGSPGKIVKLDFEKSHNSHDKDGNQYLKNPYPNWSDTTKYSTGDKVVWAGNIYQALVTNTGVDPTQATTDDNSPWRIIGPIL